MKSNLEKMLVRVRNKEIDFGAFVESTRVEFRRMALSLMRKWSTPEWFLVDDVEQELYLGAWRHIPKFDPKHGVAFDRYIVFNAMAWAKREMHKARGVPVHGSPDKVPSRFETPTSFLGDDGEGEALAAAILAESAVAEAELIESQSRRRAATAALRACVSPKERTAVLAIREAGCLDNAAQVLYDDVDLRTGLRLGSERQAEKFIEKHAGAVAHRIVECVGIV